MRVLHVITGLGIGGAEQQLRLLLRHLPVESGVVTLTNPGAVAAGIEADGTPVTHLGMTGNRDLGALPRLARVVRQGRYDLVHTHLYRACVYGRAAARIAGVRRIVATEHSLGAHQIEGRPLSAGTRALYLASERLGTSTVAVSPSVARRLADWGCPRSASGWCRTASRPAGSPSTRRPAAGPGRRSGSPRTRTSSAGWGGWPREAVRPARTGGGGGPGGPAAARRGGRRAGGAAAARPRAGAADRVLLTGACADPPPAGATGPSLPDLLAAMDVFVSASPDEAFGLAVVEALAAGLPVLYAACPAIEDLPADAAPGARRTGGSVPELAAALRGTGAAGPGRLPVPEAARHYDIARSARQLMSSTTRPSTAHRRPCSTSKHP